MIELLYKLPLKTAVKIRDILNRPRDRDSVQVHGLPVRKGIGEIVHDTEGLRL